MNETLCPKCGSKEIRKGKMAATVGEVYMYPHDNLRHKPSPVAAAYCRSCGYVLSFYVEHPEALD